MIRLAMVAVPPNDRNLAAIRQVGVEHLGTSINLNSRFVYERLV
jgi:hypothetical protein